MSDNSQAEVNRIVWQCRRGMRELDELLIPFARTHYTSLSREQQQTFEALLDTEDQQLIELLMLREEAADSMTTDVITQIRDAVSV